MWNFRIKKSYKQSDKRVKFTYKKKTKMKQASDFSSAILEAEAPTDYFHKSSATQESSTSQGKIHQPDWKKENLGLNNDSPGLYSEKVYHTQA